MVNSLGIQISLAKATAESATFSEEKGTESKAIKSYFCWPNWSASGPTLIDLYPIGLQLMGLGCWQAHIDNS